MARTEKFTILDGESIYHQNKNIKARDLSLEQYEKIRAIVLNCYMMSEDYKVSQPAHPFLQSHREPDEDEDNGWIFIEFWTDRLDAIQAFVDYVNQRLGL